MAETKERSTKLILLILIVTSYFLLLALADLDFDFPSFNQSNLDNYITFEGHAGHADPSSNSIYLTNSIVNQNHSFGLGWAAYKHPVRLWCKRCKRCQRLGSFQTHFQFQIINISKSQNEFSADGLAFFMAPVGSAPPMNGVGMWLGLFNETTNGKNSTQIVAVEFDTYKNVIPPNNTKMVINSMIANDPNDNHIGIDVNNITSVEIYSPKQHLNADNITWDAWVHYNGTEMTLRVFVAANDTSKPSDPILSYQINLSDYLPENVLVGFSASTGASSQLHIINSWNFSIQTPWASDSDDSIKRIIIISVCCFVAISAMTILFFCVLRQRNMKTRSEREQDRKKLSRDIKSRTQGTRSREYKYNELKAATNNFSEEQKLGEGGFGNVYMGVLQDSMQTVAVKRISAGSRQGSEEYLSEVTIIDRLRHRNLVPLLGWCHEQPSELLLVYRFMSNGSLDKYLLRSSAGAAADRPNLGWNIRYRIACDLASALVYLHDEFEQRVVHRDIKSSNIMLDSEFRCHLGDFGLARVLERGDSSHFTAPGGTRGYLAPESVLYGIASAETDVFSFGVVTLEIASGRQALHQVGRLSQVSYWPLVEWVWSLYGKHCLLDASDNRLQGVFDAREMERLMVVGLWCCNPDWKQRPNMREVIQTLKFEAVLPTLPPKMPGMSVFQLEFH